MTHISLGYRPSSAVAGKATVFTREIKNLYFSDKLNVRLLDIGTGKGHFLLELGAGFESTGVDRNGVANHSVDISYQKLPFQDNYFDIVTAWQVFEHLENPFFAGREVERVLNPGGFFIMSVPNIKNLRSRLYYLLHAGVPRWGKKNDHIFVPLESVLKKTIFKNYVIIRKETADGGLMAKIFPGLFGKNLYYIGQKNYQK